MNGPATAPGFRHRPTAAGSCTRLERSPRGEIMLVEGFRRVVQLSRREPLTHINVVLKWFEELKRRVPVE